MTDGPYIVGFFTTDDKYQPLAWSNHRLSKKRLRSIVRNKFKREGDFEKSACVDWWRLYNSKQEMKHELPEVK